MDKSIKSQLFKPDRVEQVSAHPDEETFNDGAGDDDGAMVGDVPTLGSSAGELPSHAQSVQSQPHILPRLLPWCARWWMRKEERSTE